MRDGDAELWSSPDQKIKHDAERIFELQTRIKVLEDELQESLERCIFLGERCVEINQERSKLHRDHKRLEWFAENQAQIEWEIDGLNRKCRVHWCLYDQCYDHTEWYTDWREAILEAMRLDSDRTAMRRYINGDGNTV